jgi:hypothetical protein
MRLDQEADAGLPALGLRYSGDARSVIQAKCSRTVANRARGLNGLTM